MSTIIIGSILALIVLWICIHLYKEHKRGRNCGGGCGGCAGCPYSEDCGHRKT